MASRGRRHKRGGALPAVAHPLRRRILRRLGEREGPTTSIQLAEELKEPLGAIAYHVRVLWRVGAISAGDEEEQEE